MLMTQKGWCISSVLKPHRCRCLVLLPVAWHCIRCNESWLIRHILPSRLSWEWMKMLTPEPLTAYKTRPWSDKSALGLLNGRSGLPARLGRADLVIGAMILTLPMVLNIVIHYTVIFNKETMITLWNQGSLSLLWQCLLESLSQWYQTLLRRMSRHAGQDFILSFRLTYLSTCLELAFRAPYYASASSIAAVLEFNEMGMLGRRAVSEFSSILHFNKPIALSTTTALTAFANFCKALRNILYNVIAYGLGVFAMISTCYVTEPENAYQMMHDAFPDIQIWIVACVCTTSTLTRERKLTPNSSA